MISDKVRPWIRPVGDRDRANRPPLNRRRTPIRSIVASLIAPVGGHGVGVEQQRDEQIR
jgi:hypothetical protein